MGGERHNLGEVMMCSVSLQMVKSLVMGCSFGNHMEGLDHGAVLRVVGSVVLTSQSINWEAK